MGSIPFSLYDFFGYLAAGALYLIVADHALGGLGLLQKEPPFALQVFWLICAYVVGHVNAHWSSWLLEARIARKLGPPSETLFAKEPRRLFAHFRSPLPKEHATKILDKYETMTGSREPGETMYLFCFHHVKEHCPQASARISTFIALYGFARSMTLAAMATALVLAGLAYTQQDPHAWQLAGLTAVAAVTLFYRFLKFYRLCSVEVFSSFRTGVPEVPPSKPPLPLVTTS